MPLPQVPLLTLSGNSGLDGSRFVKCHKRGHQNLAARVRTCNVENRVVKVVVERASGKPASRAGQEHETAFVTKADELGPKEQLTAPRKCLTRDA